MDPQAQDEEARAREWLRDANAGSSTAFEAFYRHFHGRAYLFALRLVRNAADASEVVNEAMFEVWRTGHAFSGTSRVRTWLFGVVNHRAIDLLRRRRHHVDLADTEEPADESATPASDAIAGAQDAARLRHCVEQLPERQRAVVHLTFFDELSYPEISAALGVPTGTVKTRMMHAKRKLQDCLGRIAGVVA